MISKKKKKKKTELVTIASKQDQNQRNRINLQESQLTEHAYNGCKVMNNVLIRCSIIPSSLTLLRPCITVWKNENQARPPCQNINQECTDRQTDKNKWDISTNKWQLMTIYKHTSYRPMYILATSKWARPCWIVFCNAKHTHPDSSNQLNWSHITVA